ncbi:MAG: amino acid-binding protein [Methanosarcinales archaeon]|nr:MAG: amino acid-binding protein [Methanosarcinales archaeon]
MWAKILEKFSKFPAQEKVIRLLIERGFQVNTEGKVVSGSIEIPHTQVAKEVGVDRRVVDATAELVLGDELLKKVLQNIKSVAFLKDVAPVLGLGVIIITPTDAREKGILGNVATIVAKHGVSIRQAITDDPYFTDGPKLTIITDTKIPGTLVDALTKIPSVKSVTVY